MDVSKIWIEIVRFMDKFSFMPEISLIFLGIVVLHFMYKRSTYTLEEKSKTKSLYANALFFAIRKPGIFLIWIIGITLIIEVIAEHFSRNTIISWISIVRMVSVDICLCWLSLKFVQKAESNLLNTNKVNRTTVLAVARLSKVVIVIAIVLLVLGTFNINITGVLAIGSAGTIVAGIAAKDLLANFFGGIMVFMDRPFAVGDWILSPDKEIEGTVEHIGWRITRIRRFDKRPLYVQNSLFLTLSIENPSRMHNRRIKKNLGIRYGDIAKIPKIINDIEKMLSEHPGLDHEEIALVVMNNFGDSSLDCIIYCFTETTKWVDYLKVQEDILLKAANIVHGHGADIAYPTTTLDIPDETLQGLKVS